METAHHPNNFDRSLCVQCFFQQVCRPQHHTNEVQEWQAHLVPERSSGVILAGKAAHVHSGGDKISLDAFQQFLQV